MAISPQHVPPQNNTQNRGNPPTARLASRHQHLGPDSSTTAEHPSIPPRSGRGKSPSTSGSGGSSVRPSPGAGADRVDARRNGIHSAAA